MTRRSVRSAVFATVVAFSLACAGAMEAVAPEPPVAPPTGSTTTSVNTNYNNGTGTTTMGYDTEA